MVILLSDLGEQIMEKIVEQGLLYDFYGELLTEHQKSVYEDFVYHDLSLSEIAAEYNISRQGVHDLIKRCDHTLQDYEEKLHLITKFIKIKEKVESIHKLAEEQNPDKEALIRQMKQLSDDILEEL